MSKSKAELKELFKSMKIIHAALAIGPTMLLMVSLVVVEGISFNFNDFFDNPLSWISMAFLMMLPIGSIVYKKKIANVSSLSLEEKLVTYRTSNIARWAMFEGVALFNAMFIFKSNNHSFLLFSLLAILALILAYPSKSRFMQDFNVQRSEVENFNNNAADNKML